MKIAVLGTGFGVRHVELYKKICEVQDIVVWGRNEKKLLEIGNKFNVNITTDLDEIWNDADIDLVDICLPNYLHCEVGVKAIESGKDVFIEMPLAESVEDGRKIIEIAEACKRRVFVDLFLRHEYAYEYLKTIADEGKLGKCKHLYMKRLTPPWWGNLDTEHIALNLMHHDIDFVLQLLGEPLEVNVNNLNIKENQSVVTTNFEYKDCYAKIHGSSAMPDTFPFSVGYEALFENGFIRFYDDWYKDGKLDRRLELFDGEKHQEVELQMRDCYEDVCRDVVNSIINNKPSVLDGKQALKTLEVICRINDKMKKD